MAHVFSSDFPMANGSSIVTSLETASQEAKSFSQVIDMFRSTTVNTLIGPGYNSIRSKMGLYQDALNKLSTISNNLKSNIIAAHNFLLNAMEGYSELNTADLPELNQSIEQSKRILAILKTEVPVYEKDPTTGNNVYVGTRTIGTPEQIRAYEELLAELTKLKGVLDRLEGNASAARGMISDSETDTNAFAGAVNGIAISVYK